MSSEVLKNLLEDAKNYVATAFHYFLWFLCSFWAYTRMKNAIFLHSLRHTHILTGREDHESSVCASEKNIANAYSRVLMLEIVIFYGWVMRTKMKFHRHYVCIYKTCATIIYDKVSNCPLTLHSSAMRSS